MSDSILAVFGMGWLFGIMTTVLIVGAVKGERELDRDNDVRIYIPCRDRDRSRNK